MRPSGPLLALLAGFSLPAWADRVVLPEQRSARAWLDFEVRPSRMENTAPDVVRVTPGSRWGELVFQARRAGRAEVTVRAPTGDDEVVFDVDVLAKNLHGASRVLPGIPPSVRVTVDGGHVILEGLVASEEEMDQVRDLADQASNVVVAVSRHDEDEPRVLLVDRGPAEWVRDQPRAPEITPADSESFERYRVTLLPGTFAVATHFAAAATAHSDREVVDATSEEGRTLFVARAPGTAVYVVRDDADTRWVVFDVTVIDPERAEVQRTVPPLPPGVRVSLHDGKVVLEGSVTQDSDAGAVEVVTSMFPGAIDRVTRADELPEP